MTANQGELAMPQATDAAAGSRHIGDDILNGMENMRRQFENTMTQVTQSIQAANLSPQEMINIQFMIAQASVTITLVGKEVGSVDEKVDTLLKSS